MENYITKPLKVKAIQWLGWNRQVIPIKGVIEHFKYPQLACWQDYLIEIYPNDWIVFFPNNKVKICNPENFKKKYKKYEK